jgi:hypothetical protein
MVIGNRLADAETHADVFQRFFHEGDNVLTHDLPGGRAIALAFPETIHDSRGLGGIFPDGAAAHEGDKQDTVAGVLAVGESEERSFAERVAVIPGQDVEQVMGVAQAIAEPEIVVVIIRLACAK